jgi:hypothetical protein
LPELAAAGVQVWTAVCGVMTTVAHVVVTQELPDAAELAVQLATGTLSWLLFEHVIVV